MPGDDQNPHTSILSGTSDSTDSNGFPVKKVATTLANAKLEGYFLDLGGPVSMLEIFNASTGGEYILFSVDGAKSFRTLRADGCVIFDPDNTSDTPGKGWYYITRLYIIASAATARIEVSYHRR